MKSSKIDIFDINMVYQMQFDTPPKREKHILKLVFEKVLSLGRYLILNKEKGKSNLEKQEEIEVLFFGESKNNLQVFNPILKNFSNTRHRLIKDNKDFPLVKSIYLSLPYIMILIKRYLKSNKDKKKLIRKYPFEFLFSYGKYLLASEIIEKYNPKIIFLANDHSPFNRCLLLRAKEKGVKTMYMQHASVTAKFPRLEFDYSLLDGMESFEKYRKVSKKKSKVLLMGSTRYDNFYMNEINENSNRIGIAVNQFDDFDVVKSICLQLKVEFEEFSLVVRPHPNMINWNRDWFEMTGIEYSDSSIEPSNEFLKSLRLQICNVSGIHLDAVLLKIPSVFFQLSKDKVEDQYGYIKNNLIKEARSFEELKKYIKSPNLLIPETKKAQYYLASIESSIEGNVGKVTADYIEAILNNKEQVIEKKYSIKCYEF